MYGGERMRRGIDGQAHRRFLRERLGGSDRRRWDGEARFVNDVERLDGVLVLNHARDVDLACPVTSVSFSPIGVYCPCPTRVKGMGVHP